MFAALRFGWCRSLVFDDTSRNRNVRRVFGMVECWGRRFAVCAAEEVNQIGVKWQLRSTVADGAVRISYLPSGNVDINQSGRTWWLFSQLIPVCCGRVPLYVDE